MRDILVVLASNTGNTKTFIDFLDRKTKSDLIICEDYSCDLDLFEKIAIGSFTWANGKIPEKMKKFLIDNHELLKDKQIFVFGSGNSIYPKFCKAVDSIEKICLDSGSEVIGKLKFEQRFSEAELSDEELQCLTDILQDW